MSWYAKKKTSEQEEKWTRLHNIVALPDDFLDENVKHHKT